MRAKLGSSVFALGMGLSLSLSFGCNQGGQGGHAASPGGAAADAEAESSQPDPAAVLLATQANLALRAAVIAAAIEADEAQAQADAEAAQVEADLEVSEREPDVIYVPTPEPVVDRMLELAAIEANDVVYDLGCGDGRIVIAAAQRYGVKAWGFDIDPVRVAEARENAQAAGVEDLVTIEQKDIFTLDLAPASVITLYLLPELNVRLIPQLTRLKPGSRIVSHDFGIEGVTPLAHETLTLGRRDEHEIFLWHSPLEQNVPMPEGSLEPEPQSKRLSPDRDTGTGSKLPSADVPKPESQPPR